MPTRRQVIKYGTLAGAGAWAQSKFGWMRRAMAVPLAPGLSDPALQPKFMEVVPNALDPGFIYTPSGGEYTVGVGPADHYTGLKKNGSSVSTPIFGYGAPGGPYTWPGKTFQVKSGATTTVVNWKNELGNYHLLPVDTSLHWCYSLDGYDYTIAANGVPIITHLHGGHSDFQFDGNPEFFYSPGGAIQGPQWGDVPGGFTDKFVYDNDVPAGNLWYHDHALGITRLNVYAGMAGFYFVRDEDDTGDGTNSFGLPVYPYEIALAIQDRMFRDTGELFYPAYPGDPFYDDFITGEGAVLPPEIFPDGGPTALAEFFGDHMVVNGKIWPYAAVQPRNYRMRLLNGCDSRFLGVRFRAATAGATDLANAGAPIPFWVIGSDQGLAFKATDVDTLLMAPGERYDVVFDFKNLQGMRIIMENIGGDAPFGGQLVGPGFPAADLFPNRQTDRIMAFDVEETANQADGFDPKAIQVYQKNKDKADVIRKVALFEGSDEFGRLQPLLGTAEPTVDVEGNLVNGAIAWHSPTTENPALDDTEIWEIYNATADAHPVHLHLVHFEILDRQKFTAKLVPQPVLQHNGELGQGFRLEKIKKTGKAVEADGVERAPKDMVTALPGEVTRIKVKFDKSGRYVWHCHILSHEDHEMMRVLQVED